MIAAVWLLVALRIASEFTGRGAPFWQVDLATLHREQASFYAGVYPHFAVAPVTAGQPQLWSDYPPFSLPLFVPWLPPGLDFSSTRIWFMLCEAIAGGLLVRFAWRAGSHGGRAGSWLLVGSVLAMTGLRADLLFGNVALIVTAILLTLKDAAESGHWRVAAAAWMASMVKPQMGWLFALMFVPRHQWKAIGGAVGGLALLAGATCWWTGVSPLRIIASGYSASLTTIAGLAERNSLVSLLCAAGVPASGALVACGLAGFGVGWWAMRGRLAEAEPLRQLAFLGLVNRVCTYHNYCDDLLLVFAVIWLGRRAWMGGTKTDWMAFVVLGITVWLPSAALAYIGVKILVVLGWMVLAGWISRCPTERASQDFGAATACPAPRTA